MNKLLLLLVLMLASCAVNNSKKVSAKGNITENNVNSENNNVSDKSKGIIHCMSGVVCIGHEVRSFKPDDSEEEFWIIDKTGTLNQKYDSITGGMKNGKPLRATLKLEYDGMWEDGFAAEYSGVYFVREIIKLGE